MSNNKFEATFHGLGDDKPEPEKGIVYQALTVLSVFVIALLIVLTIWGIWAIVGQIAKVDV
jgi:hypothetical protein